MKFSTIITAAAVVLVAQADLASYKTAINKIATDANSVYSSVNGFSSSQGILGALGIQSGSTRLSSDLDTAVSAAGTLSTADSAAIASTYANLGTPVTNLLQALASKKNDFTQVGAASIVTQDLTELQGKTNQLQSAIYKVISCAQESAVVSTNQKINSAYASTNSAYGNANAAAPAASCK